ncbi:MAG: signal recognition particle receptor subunit alpha, partial [Terriglobales bacterium]
MAASAVGPIHRSISWSSLTVFDSLSSRLSTVFKGLRSKGRLSDSDIDATIREIRVALLEADVA